MSFIRLGDESKIQYRPTYNSMDMAELLMEKGVYRFFQDGKFISVYLGSDKMYTVFHDNKKKRVKRVLKTDSMSQLVVGLEGMGVVDTD